ncbi:MAG: hypothetical protein JWL72_1663 [Ilumatobacteraceae bacterium]|nr:hypothetical protein [Ilumatobacteraceae bacterium]MCU1388325.1 hypothetical protein [Ilumatobacteraceae bacterium]
MSAKKDSVAIVGVGAAACAACCAGPTLGFLAAIGLGTAAGIAVFGFAALLVGAVAAATMAGRRRRRRKVACAAAVSVPQPVELTAARSAD